jgi:hypothetical protein
MIRRLIAASVLLLPFAAPAEVFDDIPGGQVQLDDFTLCGDPVGSRSEMIRFFDVPDIGNLKDVNVGFRATHVWRSDIKLHLRHPDGTVVMLMPGINNDGSDNYDVLIDGESQAPLSDGNSDSTAAPFFDRTVRSERPLKVLNGKPSKGIWILYTCDVNSVDFDGFYLSAQLQITPAEAGADLSLSRVEASDPLTRLRRQTTYTVQLQNVGADPAQAALTLPIPANAMYNAGSLSAPEGTATYNTAQNLIEWNGIIPAATTIPVSFRAESTVATGTISFQGTLTGFGIKESPSGTITVVDPLNGGGADARGYVARDNYTPQGPAFAWRDLTNGATALALTDDNAVAVTSPFPIAYRGVSSSTLTVGNNGGIVHGVNNGIVGFFNTPVADRTDRFIAPLWDDLGADAGGVRTKVFGTAPNREFAIQWTRGHLVQTTLPDSDTATFQVVFFEGSTRILFQYQDIDFDNFRYDWGAMSAIGITDGTGTGGTIQFGFEERVLLNGLAIEFRDAIAEPGESVWMLR